LIVIGGVHYYDNDVLRVENFFKNKQLHRVGDPAIIYYHNDGSKNHEAWYKNGEYIK